MRSLLRTSNMPSMPASDVVMTPDPNLQITAENDAARCDFGISANAHGRI
ncbi:MAG: hypothetical protein QM757_05125 [Paludibaculum sp.]